VIETREDALRFIKISSMAFLVYAAIQMALFSVLIALGSPDFNLWRLTDPTITAICGLWLFWRKSPHIGNRGALSRGVCKPRSIVRSNRYWPLAIYLGALDSRLCSNSSNGSRVQAATRRS
jgi:hypothetical protein